MDCSTEVCADSVLCLLDIALLFKCVDNYRLGRKVTGYYMVY